MTSVLRIRYTCCVQVDNYSMKKTAITLLACAALGVAYGQEEQQKSGFGLELNAAYNFALRDIMKFGGGSNPKVNTYGADLTALYSFNKHHAVNIRFGWTTGDDTIDENGDGYSFSDKYEVQNLYIMPGYRYTGNISDSLHFFGGANLGIAQTKLTDKWAESYEGETISEKEDKSKWGLAWSVEAGVMQDITERSKVTLAVQLMGLSGRPTVYEEKAETQLNLGVRLGYSCQF